MMRLNYYVSKSIVKQTGENGYALDFASRDPYFDTHRGGAVRGGRNNIYNNNYTYTYNNNINDMKIIISFRPAAL